MLTYTASYSIPKHLLKSLDLIQRPQIEALCAYRDVSGLFTTELPEDIEIDTQENDRIEEPPVAHSVDNEDDLLYGDGSTFQMPAPPQMKPQETVSKKPPW